MMNIKLLRPFSALLSPLFLLSCTTKTVAPEPTQWLEVIKLENPPVLGKTKAGQEIFLGGFSSLQLLKKDGADLVFASITDRGPNAGEMEVKGQKVRPFLLPDFSPLRVELTYNTISKKLRVTDQKNFTDEKNKNITGFPPVNTKGKEKGRYEVAVDVFGKPLKISGQGMDSEGYCSFQNTHLVSEEYGPDLLQFDSNMKLTHRWRPGQGLPEDFKLRKTNRGLEALACDGERAYTMLQSHLNSKNPLDQNHIRLAQFNPNTGKTEKEFFYPVVVNEADKIGDMTWVQGKRFLVIEQNGDLGREKGLRKVYQVNLDLAAADGTISKDLVVDLNSLGLDFAEKVEGIAVIDAKTLAVIIDNDFGLAGDTDIKTGLVSLKKDEVSYMALVHLEKALY